MPIEYAEPQDKVKPGTKELSRALSSLVEELQAVDWYQQRVDISENEDLRRILSHNRDEEKQHASLLMEWLRRSDPKFAERMQQFLFSKGNLGEIAENAG
ncbi:MAG: hypothetical protein M0Z94_15910 [Dehalococcoidales bacterium]|nr:hypothetical protein [Dehalococcoidales bacterium]